MLDPRTFDALLARLRELDPDLARHYDFAHTWRERSRCYIDLLDDVHAAEARHAQQQRQGGT